MPVEAGKKKKRKMVPREYVTGSSWRLRYRILSVYLPMCLPVMVNLGRYPLPGAQPDAQNNRDRQHRSQTRKPGSGFADPQVWGTAIRTQTLLVRYQGHSSGNPQGTLLYSAVTMLSQQNRHRFWFVVI